MYLKCRHRSQQIELFNRRDGSGSTFSVQRLKGYGFIQPQGGGKDVFVHISAVKRAGLQTLNDGQIAQYELVDNSA